VRLRHLLFDLTPEDNVASATGSPSMRSIRRPALLLAAAVGTVALGYEPAPFRDLSFEGPGSRLSIGAVRLPHLAAALAQADQIVLDDVTLVQGTGTYSAKRIMLSGVGSARTEIEAVFDRNAPESLADRLSRIHARQVMIPELVTDQQVGPVRQRTTYRNMIASDIRHGHIASLTADEGTQESDGPPGRSTATHGRLTLTGLAAPDLARIYVEKGDSQPAAFTKVYDRFSIEDIRHRAPNGASVRIAKAEGRDVRMRPTEESWSGSTSLISAMTEIDQPSAAETNRLAVAVADLLGAFEIGLAELHGLSIDGITDKGDPVGVRLRRVAYSGARADRPSEMRLEGFDSAVREGTTRFAALVFTGFSFQATREGVKALKGKSLDDLDATTIRSLIPTIGTVQLSGLDLDVLDARNGGPKPRRIHVAVKDLELTADKPLNGIPTNIRIGLRNLAMPLPPDSPEDGIKTLLSLGYGSVDLSFAVAATWNAAGNEIILSELSASGAEMLNVKAGAVLGNVTKDVFDADTALATVAALGTTAKSLDVRIENTGFFERYLAQEARKLQKTPDVLRREYGSAAAVALPRLLGNSDQARKLGQAVARFVAKPARLQISARAKGAEGIGVADVAALPTPAAILERLEITASTDDRL
jgi:hypothetical protein